MRLRVRPEPAALVSDEIYFFRVVSALFRQRRKTILNNLKAGRESFKIGLDEQIMAALTESGIAAQRRAETLTMPEMARLAGALLLSAGR